jgi:putative membrane protein insertion efficiency factor
MSLAQRLAILFVHAYQLVLSPFSGGACRFEPSCSHYAIASIERHGVGRGLWLALVRVSKCHPLGPHGIDPVPPVK